MTIGVREKIGMTLFLTHGCLSVNEAIEIINDKRVRDIIVEGELKILSRIGLTQLCECGSGRCKERYYLTQKGVDLYGVFFAEGLFFSNDHLSKKGKSFKKRLENYLGNWFYSISCKESNDLVSDFKSHGKYK